MYIYTRTILKYIYIYTIFYLFRFCLIVHLSVCLFAISAYYPYEHLFHDHMTQIMIFVQKNQQNLRICGTVWNSSPTAVIHAAAAAAYTSCTWSTPFKFGVRFDAQESTRKFICKLWPFYVLFTFLKCNYIIFLSFCVYLSIQISGSIFIDLFSVKTPIAAIDQNTAENADGAIGSGWGATGFYMAYWQNTC